jgi:hypothetical protein
MTRSNEERLVRGQRAAQLLEDPTLLEVFDDLIGGASKVIFNSEVNDQQGREVAFRQAHAATIVRRALTRMVDDAEMARMDILQAQRDEAARGR